MLLGSLLSDQFADAVERLYFMLSLSNSGLVPTAWKRLLPLGK
jgi:hypothetical protein